MNTMPFMSIVLSVTFFFNGDTLYAENQKDPGVSYTEVDNEVAVKEFGIKKEDPIERGFFFWKGEFISPPYVVERRGLAIFINGKCIDSGVDWPPEEYIVKEDPGDPPKEVNSFESLSKEYWVKKARYLIGNFPHEKAKQIQIELWKKIPDIISVESDKTNIDCVVITSNIGKKRIVKLSDKKLPQVSKDESMIIVRDKTEKDTLDLINALRSGSIIEGDSGEISSDISLKLLEEILSDNPANEKFCNIVKTLTKQDISKYKDIEFLANMDESKKINAKIRELRDAGSFQEAAHLFSISQMAPIFFPIIQKCSSSESLKKQYQRALSNKNSGGSNEKNVKPAPPSTQSNDDLTPVPRPPYGK